jgi:hypothetical protein
VPGRKKKEDLQNIMVEIAAAQGAEESGEGYGEYGLREIVKRFYFRQHLGGVNRQWALLVARFEDEYGPWIFNTFKSTREAIRAAEARERVLKLHKVCCGFEPQFLENLNSTARKIFADEN